MSSDPAMAYGHWFTDAWFLVALVVLAYDHCLTLESEIKFIWQKSKRFSFFFIALRYTSLFINIGMVIFVFSNVPPERCHALSIGRIALLIVQSVLGGIGLGMRIYVMYNFSRTVLVFLSCVGILVTVLAAWSITGGDGWILATGFDGCQYAVSKSRAIRQFRDFTSLHVVLNLNPQGLFTLRELAFVAREWMAASLSWFTST
ncbi:hypothetical protein C8F04DRAFT_1173128 [Mycena alexandri]|uniref:DUF6533 domain-containing protein n=1 Tax=Mycena alexandri TaxID=1745969 RepID=A0AAD6THG8_9AGAR|nr:hypothetical protein C8F04DRAFT_1173128 [Mycena alexandri]